MFDVITIGSATRDIFLKSPLFKIVRDPKHLTQMGFPTGEAECFALGAKINVETMVRSTGGDAMNAAVTFARQGFRTAAIVKIGDDEAGREITQDMKDEKVTLLAAPRKGENDYATILLSGEGERTILVHRSTPLTKKEVPFAKLRARWAYIAPGDMSHGLVRELFDTCKEQHIQIAFNPSGYLLDHAMADVLDFVGRADVVIMNREEAARMTDASYKNEKAIFKKLDKLVHGIAIVTDGGRGALVSDNKNVYRCGTFKERERADRTGAGDAFGSGFVAGFIRSNDICYSLRLAAANATSVVESIGAENGILTEKEFRAPRWKFLNLDIDPLG